jgi:hypothetical protein
MSQALWEGISMGLVLSAMIGPVFFALIQNSLEHGFRYAAVLALGILLSDLIYVVVTYFSISLLAQYPFFEIGLGYAGGAVLIGFGISTILKKNKNRPNSGGIPLPEVKEKNRFYERFWHQRGQSVCTAILDFHRRTCQPQVRIPADRYMAVLCRDSADGVQHRPAKGFCRKAALRLRHPKTHVQTQYPRGSGADFLWEQIGKVCLGEAGFNGVILVNWHNPFGIF